jgi:hypothetical protein
MKKLITLSLMLLAASGFGQVWQNIGTSFGSSVSKQELHIDQTTGEIFIAYIENGTTRTTVKKWVGGAWVNQGTANFGPTGTVDVRITSIDGAPYVALKYLSGGNYYIRAYRLSSGAWVTMGSMQYETVLTYDFSLKTSVNDGLYLNYYNQTALAGSDNELIVLQISNVGQGQVEGIINTDYTENNDFVVDENDLPWVAYEVGDMSNYVNLSSGNYPDYDYQDQLLSDWSGKIVTNLVGAEDLRFACDVDGNSLAGRRYDIGGLSMGPLYTVYNGTVDDYDMASETTFDYFFYKVGAAHHVESINSTGVQASLGSNFTSGTGTLSQPKIETWSGRIVISYLKSGFVYVMEIDNPCSLLIGDTFAGCEQTLTTAPTVSVTVDDNNYTHANLSVVAASTNTTVIPNVNVAMVGTYPYYYLQFTSFDIAADENVEFEFETIESGSYTNYVTFLADVIANPTATITYTNNEICENAGLVNLIPHGSPAGGFWTGTGVSTVTSKFNPDVANPGTHTINYTYFNSYGCYDTESASVIVHPVPSVTVATTAANCGATDGTANATITGGTPTYTIYWSNGSSVEDQTNLAAGMYFINVTDSEGCGVTKPATVSSNGLTLSGTVTDVLCSGANSGAIDLTATSTAGIDEIEWSNGATTEDISGLLAGTYEVTVTANDGCISTATFTVGAPTGFSFSEVVTSATCGNTDGDIVLTVTGGTAPYDYQWFATISGSPVGTNSASLLNVDAGAYFVIVTDDNGCSIVHNTMIGEVGAPEVVISSVTPAGCTDDGAINISINTDVPVSLIEWNSGQTTEDISGLTPGFYTVEVTDQSGCMGMGGVEVPAAAPDINPICLVTVDTSTNTNLLVWEKPITTDIDYFKIYRETSVAGEFQFVANVPYADESIYNDLVASPSVRSWRYKLSAVNFCGEESDLSEFHKTIHLTISFGLGNTINLNWDEYEGFAFSTFNLYRHTTAGGWNLIQSLPSTQFSYTDSPASINGLDYIISITPPATCTSTKAQDHNSTRSNKTASITGDLVGLNEVDETGTTSVYPNPSTGEFNLYVNTENANGFDVVVTDAQGRVVMQFSSLDANTIIDLSAFSDGVYNLQILVDDQIINRKLVKQ